MTPLQRHVSYFDPEGTGFITMGQTARGLRRLGVPLILRLLLTPLINGLLGLRTTKKPGFRVHIDRIADAKHPFDSGVYDERGEIDDAAFEALFSGIQGDSITVAEYRAVIVARGNRRPEMGPISAALGNWFSDKEVRLLFCVAADTVKQQGRTEIPAMRKRTLRLFFEGTLLDSVARARVWARSR